MRRSRCFGRASAEHDARTQRPGDAPRPRSASPALLRFSSVRRRETPRRSRMSAHYSSGATSPPEGDRCRRKEVLVARPSTRKPPRNVAPTAPNPTHIHSPRADVVLLRFAPPGPFLLAITARDALPLRRPLADFGKPVRLQHLLHLVVVEMGAEDVAEREPEVVVFEFAFRRARLGKPLLHEVGE